MNHDRPSKSMAPMPGTQQKPFDVAVFTAPRDSRTPVQLFHFAPGSS
jgi:hypothetical protein